MKNNLIKYLALSLILILLLNSGFYVLLYLSSIKIVKKTIHYLLEKNELEEELIIISLARNDINNNRVSFQRIDKKEFRFNGDMYDIKKDLSDKDTLRYLCYLDEHENLLEKLFSKFSEKRKDKKSNHNISLISFLALFFNETETLRNVLFASYYSPQFNFSLNNFYEDIPTPPPQGMNFIV